jgi:hypothetical protein
VSADCKECRDFAVWCASGFQSSDSDRGWAERMYFWAAHSEHEKRSAEVAPSRRPETKGAKG